MNAVLYTHQLEPITVVDIPMWLWDRLAEGHPIFLEVMQPVPSNFLTADDVGPAPKKVAIFGERLRRRNHETLMLFTGDEENALLLRSAFLPGQHGEVQNRECRAFAAGFLKALQDFRA